jgi:hypothetical protein
MSHSLHGRPDAAPATNLAENPAADGMKGSFTASGDVNESFMPPEPERSSRSRPWAIHSKLSVLVSDSPLTRCLSFPVV